MGLREIHADLLDGIQLKGKKEQTLGWAKSHPVFRYEVDNTAKAPSKAEQQKEMFDKHPELAKIFSVSSQSSQSAENNTIDTNSLLASFKKIGAGDSAVLNQDNM